MGTNENSKNIHVSYDITPEERENLREKKEKKKKKKRRKRKRKMKVVFSWRHARAGKKIEQHFIPRSFYEQKGVKDTSTLGAK